MIEDLKKDNGKLKNDNDILNKERNRLLTEEETLDIRLKSILK